MDVLQQQINSLNQKVEQLNYIVERLSGQLTVLTPPHPSPSSSGFSGEDSLQPLPRLSHRPDLPPVMTMMPVSENVELVGNNEEPMHGNDNLPQYRTYDQYQGRYRATLEHKDVLLEDEPPQPIPSTVHEFAVSSEIQIRRLMAQLTAAYNRIATLEEQLLACRMQS